MPGPRPCIEGCGNMLSDTDRKRFPEYLSRPLPPAQQSAEYNDIEKLNMRLRCSSCYNLKYKKLYYAISYRWAFENRSHSRATVTIYDESVPNNGRRTRTRTPGIPIPIPYQMHRKIIMDCPLFFLDVLDAPSGSAQWYTSNLVETYGSCLGVKVLLTASDDRALFENRLYSIHQTTLTRDRGGYLSQPFGKQERTAAYSRLSPDSIRFYSMFGTDMGNIEVSDLVKGPNNVYQGLLENGQHMLFDSGNTRNPGSLIAKRVSIPRHIPEERKPLRGEVPAYGLNPDRNFDADGNLPVPTPAYVSPGSMPADWDSGFVDPSLAGMGLGTTTSMLGSDFGASILSPSYNSSPNITDLSESDQLLLASRDPSTTTSMLGSDFGTSLIPQSLNPFSNVAGIGGSAEFLPTSSATTSMLGHEYGPSLIPSSYNHSPSITDLSESDQLLLASRNPSATTSMMGSDFGASFNLSYHDSSLNVAGDASMASMTDTMAGMNMSSEFGHSFDPYSNHMNQFQHPGQM